MPTDRFYRLPEEKKQMIRAAAIREFARVPFEKASINQIIQNAEISRGSFYTYFADKQDVVAFLFEDSQKQMKARCLETLRNNHGDYFGMCRAIFDVFVEKLQETTDMLEMVRNVLSYQDNAKAMGLGNVPDFSCDAGDGESLFRLFSEVDVSRWRIRDPEEFVPLMEMGMAALMIALTQFYRDPDSLEQIRSSYDKRLEILRLGVYEAECQNNDEEK